MIGTNLNYLCLFNILCEFTTSPLLNGSMYCSVSVGNWLVGTLLFNINIISLIS